MSNRIIIDSNIQHGKPVIKGTRLPITRILGGLAGGMSFGEIMKEYEISQKDILAALDFANEIIEKEEYHPIANTR